MALGPNARLLPHGKRPRPGHQPEESMRRLRGPRPDAWPSARSVMPENAAHGVGHSRAVAPTAPAGKRYAGQCNAYYMVWIINEAQTKRKASGPLLPRAGGGSTPGGGTFARRRGPLMKRTLAHNYNGDVLTHYLLSEWRGKTPRSCRPRRLHGARSQPSPRHD